VDEITGRTPKRRKFNYPTEWSLTRPHIELLKDFREGKNVDLNMESTWDGVPSATHEVATEVLDQLSIESMDISHGPGKEIINTDETDKDVLPDQMNLAPSQFASDENDIIVRTSEDDSDRVNISGKPNSKLPRRALPRRAESAILGNIENLK